MTPKVQTSESLRTLAFVDTEAYVWLAAEFFEGNERTGTAIPLWRSRPSSAGGNLFDLAGDFYVSDREHPTSPESRTHNLTGKDLPRWLFRSLVPAHDSFEQKINTGDLSESNFNPQAMSR
jgi:hypothetical protein